MVLPMSKTLYYRCLLLTTSATLAYILGVQIVHLNLGTDFDLRRKYYSVVALNLRNSSMTIITSTKGEHNGPRDVYNDGGWAEWIRDDRTILPNNRMPSYLHIPPNASKSEIAEYRSRTIQVQKTLVKETMPDFYLKRNKLKEYLLESGGQPMRNLIFTTWRSGSSFLGRLLADHPGTFYHYEPLIHWGMNQVREDALGEKAIQLFQDILHCNYNNLTTYWKYMERAETMARFIFSRNARVGKYCNELEICKDPNWLSQMCELFPIQLIKTVRIRLKFARKLLEDPKFKVRLLHLVRDPRGTIRSRRKLEWCKSPDCLEPANLCTDLAQDFDEAQKLREMFPKTFAVIRYEDMCSNISKATQEIYDFFGLQFTAKTREFLMEHTSKTAGEPFQWIGDESINFTAIQSIQNDCKAAMDLWGYKMLNSIDDRQRFEPTKLSQLPGMFLRKGEIERNEK